MSLITKLCTQNMCNVFNYTSRKILKRFWCGHDVLGKLDLRNGPC